MTAILNMFFLFCDSYIAAKAGGHANETVEQDEALIDVEYTTWNLEAISVIINV
jgi:hypothetical protein